MKELKAKMKFKKSCKNSVVFEAVEKNDLCSSIYVLNAAFEKLEKPKEIELVIRKGVS